MVDAAARQGQCHDGSLGCVLGGAGEGQGISRRQKGLGNLQGDAHGGRQGDAPAGFAGEAAALIGHDGHCTQGVRAQLRGGQVGVQPVGAGGLVVEAGAQGLPVQEEGHVGAVGIAPVVGVRDLGRQVVLIVLRQGAGIPEGHKDTPAHGHGGLHDHAVTAVHEDAVGAVGHGGEGHLPSGELIRRPGDGDGVAGSRRDTGAFLTAHQRPVQVQGQGEGSGVAAAGIFNGDGGSGYLPEGKGLRCGHAGDPQGGPGGSGDAHALIRGKGVVRLFQLQDFAALVGNGRQGLGRGDLGPGKGELGCGAHGDGFRRLSGAHIAAVGVEGHLQPGGAGGVALVFHRGGEVVAAFRRHGGQTGDEQIRIENLRHGQGELRLVVGLVGLNQRGHGAVGQQGEGIAATDLRGEVDGHGPALTRRQGIQSGHSGVHAVGIEDDGGGLGVQVALVFHRGGDGDGPAGVKGQDAVAGSPDHALFVRRVAVHLYGGEGQVGEVGHAGAALNDDAALVVEQVRLVHQQGHVVDLHRGHMGAAVGHGVGEVHRHGFALLQLAVFAFEEVDSLIALVDVVHIQGGNEVVGDGSLLVVGDDCAEGDLVPLREAAAVRDGQAAGGHENQVGPGFVHRHHHVVDGGGIDGPPVLPAAHVHGVFGAVVVHHIEGGDVGTGGPVGVAGGGAQAGLAVAEVPDIQCDGAAVRVVGPGAVEHRRLAVVHGEVHAGVGDGRGIEGDVGGDAGSIGRRFRGEVSP